MSLELQQMRSILTPVAAELQCGVCERVKGYLAFPLAGVYAGRRICCSCLGQEDYAMSGRKEKLTVIWSSAGEHRVGTIVMGPAL